MTKTEKNFNNRLYKRTQSCRKKTTYTQEQMAEKLGITFFAYQKYEIRSPIKHYLIPSFCKITNTNVNFLLTGEEINKTERKINGN